MGFRGAVLDWELSTAGDPLADVGLLVAYWNETGAAARQADALFKEPVTELAGFPTTSELIDTYALVSGRDLEDLGYWIAIAYWKIAIIVEGVYRRWLNDPVNGSSAETLRPAVARLARLSREAISGSRNRLS
jgi:aminoglycoside phosphotransferase (APT) family kinase protein